MNANERYAYNFARNAPEEGHAWWSAMGLPERKAVMRAFDHGFVNPR